MGGSGLLWVGSSGLPSLVPKSCDRPCETALNRLFTCQWTGHLLSFTHTPSLNFWPCRVCHSLTKLCSFTSVTPWLLPIKCSHVHPDTRYDFIWPSASALRCIISGTQNCRSSKCYFYFLSQKHCLPSSYCLVSTFNNTWRDGYTTTTNNY